MTYDYAYAYYDGQQGTFYDSLIIAYSTNCGDTWFAITREGGTQLATAGGLSTEFTPTSSQWENVSLDLSAYASEDNITFAFVGVNGYGNNLYVDNINVQGGSTTAPPSADFVASNTTICAGESVSFINISTGTPTSYSWSFPGGNPSSSSQTNPVVTYNNPGTYTVTLTATNAGGSDTETKSNYIVVGSGPSLSLSSTPAACSGINNGTATVVASGGAGNYTYSWTGTSSTSATAINLAPGQYTVTVEDANGCNSSASVTVGANTDVSVQLQVTDNSASGGISSISSAVSGGVMPYTYLWSNGDITESITGIGAGNYSLTVTDANGCTGAASGSIAGVGIQELEWLAYVSLYPNPTSSSISLDIALIQEEDLSIQLLNPLGQIILEEELIDFQSGLRQFDLKNLAIGVYFVRISNQEASKLLRFVKKN
jgi:PKD repeat protein